MELEGVLVGGAAEKKTRALESKLIGITQKVDAMYGRVVILMQHITEVFNRLPCTIATCNKGPG